MSFSVLRDKFYLDTHFKNQTDAYYSLRSSGTEDTDYYNLMTYKNFMQGNLLELDITHYV
ncbi:hypothetical protein KP509_33G003000 [Ceratopteris richardii]|uniref:Uncharacterized protein n=1 Tax=Ceratopteris richardii TaxID=49495 RepID=A0A8T2QNF7_CERRI|nr:hypothetical protein KP509_33G003000 [Ceratopteris richardii]